MCFFWAFLCRFLTHYGYLEIEEDFIRFTGSLFFMWDLVLFLWSFDFPWTYILVDQPVLTMSRGLVHRSVFLD